AEDRARLLSRVNEDLSSEIAERKRVECELQASEQRFELAVRGCADGIWDWDIATDEVYYSPQLKAMLGYQVEELHNVFESFVSHLHPEDHARILQALRDHLEKHLTYDVEYRLRNKQGDYRWFRARGQAVWDAEGKATRMAGSI